MYVIAKIVAVKSDMSKIPTSAPNLKQFLLRCEVIKLYREFLRTIKEAPEANNNRNELRKWVRHDFEANRHHTDEIVIKMMLQHGSKALKELKSSISISK